MEPLTLHPVGTVNRADALALEVGEAQLAYVSSVATILETTRNHIGVHPYVVYAGDKAVGFFCSTSTRLQPRTTALCRGWGSRAF